MPETSIVTPVDPKTLSPESKSPRYSQVTASKPPITIFIIVILIGVIVGYFLADRSSKNNLGVTKGEDIIQTANEVGSTNTTTFRDTATGTLESGGSNGEGTHKLNRQGGPSQTVYLVSSIIDLDQFVGKKVEVWGETIKAQRVGWLMDVGRVKIVE